MAASRYVGRVGGLAVALGVGAALSVAAAGSAAADARGDATSSTADRAPVSRSAHTPSRTAQTTKRSPALTSRQAPPVAARRATAVAPVRTPDPSPTLAVRAPAQPLAATVGTASATTGAVANANGTPAPVSDLPGFGILAAIRREFFNASPTLTPVIYGQTTNASGQAVVTGNLGAADADGDTLSYTYISTPQNGGTLNVDQSTGDFTYTAPSFMDTFGGFDQFNVVVTDQTPGAFPTFHGIFDLISRIPVFGPIIDNTAQLLGLASPYTNAVPARVPIVVEPTQPAAPLTGTAAALSANTPIDQNGWQRYVLTPQGCTTGTVCTVQPVSLYYKSDGVTIAPNGDITLNYTLGGQAPVVIVDYGQDVGGYTRYTYTSSSPNIIQTAYSETISNMSPIGDGAGSTTLLANSGAPLTVDYTPVWFGDGQWDGTQLQGGYQYQLITLKLPGSLTLSKVATEMTAPLRSADGYAGYFLSNSDTINRIWYAGAYTINLDEIKAGTPGFAGPYPLSILGEAAKRDRAIWAGDLLTAGQTLHDVFGADGDVLARNNLTIMANNPVKAFVLWFLSLPVAVPSSLSEPGPAPGVCSGIAKGGCEFWGATYSMNFAQNMADYYKLTGDTAFISENWAAVQRSIEYGNSLINPATGLVDVPPIASLDWSVVNRAVGQNTAANVLQYGSLTSAATLAAAIGDSASAAQYSAQAAALKQAINANLWNPALGAYDASTDARDFVVQDANTWAVLYGVADAAQSAQIVETMARVLKTDYGLRAAEAGVGGYPQIVSPFIGSANLAVNYLTNRPDLAMQQMMTTWGYMVNSEAGSTTWERINLPDGNLSASIPHLFGDSASHAWSTGATSALSDYVLGVTPTDVAYRSWQVKPFPQGLTFAQGRVPTAQGTIGVRWDLSSTAFRMTVEAPGAVPGTVAIPKMGAPRTVYQDGSPVTPASQDADYYYFTGVTGSHTWAWSTTP